MRRALLALGGLLALLVLALGAGRWYVSTAEADYGRDAVLPGLRAPVEVWRDSLGVPHLWARDEADLLRALGYVHAQDRLWQMEFFRRVADGRLAEILGPALVDTDRFLRTVGLGRAAEENLAALDAADLARLRAYAEGVNAWLDGRPGALPPEFVALRFEPEPWTPRNTLSIAKVMAWDLAQWHLGLDLQGALDRLGPALAADLFPAPSAAEVTVLGPGAEWEGPAGGRPVAATRPLAPGEATLPRIPPLAARILEGVSAARASNAWVIGGELTRSGSPILANDPHLSLRAPALWYLAALHGGETEVAGVTIPGVPGVILGHTPTVAWGFTNAMVDDVDFFVERVDERDPSRYLTPDGPVAFAVREETIRVKGAEPVVHRVRVSRHGPVLSDADPRGGERVLAMRWTALEPAQTIRAITGMNRARDARGFLEALRHFEEPHQNVVFADADGAFGYALAARVPVRRSGDGVLPVPGWTGEGEWERYLSWEERPRVLRPAEGFVVTANNRIVGGAYPFHLGSDVGEPFRALRIREMLEAGSGFTAAAVARQQTDVRDAFAARYLPHAVGAAEAIGDAEARSLLAGWDARATVDSRAAPLFYLWYEALRRRVGADEFGGARMYFPREALNRLLDAGGSAWVDDVRTPARETLADLSAAAMREALEAAAGRAWGELHSTRIEHALGASEPLERALSLHVGPFPSAGSPYTVNVAGYGSRPPFVSGHGPSMRHVVDLAAPDDEGGFIVPTGQSGVPTSLHYRDQTALWRAGRLWPIPLDRAKAASRTVTRTTLDRQ